MYLRKSARLENTILHELKKTVVDQPKRPFPEKMNQT